MLLIKRRRKIGTICGHAIYAISKSEIITVPNPAVQSDMAVSKDENRFFFLIISTCKCKTSPLRK